MAGVTPAPRRVTSSTGRITVPSSEQQQQQQSMTLLNQTPGLTLFDSLVRRDPLDKVNTMAPNKGHILAVLVWQGSPQTCLPVHPPWATGPCPVHVLPPLLLADLRSCSPWRSPLSSALQTSGALLGATGRLCCSALGDTLLVPVSLQSQSTQCHTPGLATWNHSRKLIRFLVLPT